MARIYARLIQKGSINPKTGNPYSIEDVPAELVEEVKRILGIE